MWIKHRCFDVPPGRHRIGRDFDLPAALTIGLSAEMMAANRTYAEAREEVVGMMRLLGQAINALMAAPEQATSLDRLIFCKAALLHSDGYVESLERLCTTSDDLIRVFAYVARRHVVQMELRDIAPLLARLRVAYEQPAEAELWNMLDREHRPSGYRIELTGLCLALKPYEPGFTAISVTLAPEAAYALAYQLETNALIALAAGDLALGELDALVDLDD